MSLEMRIALDQHSWFHRHSSVPHLHHNLPRKTDCECLFLIFIYAAVYRLMKNMELFSFLNDSPSHGEFIADVGLTFNWLSHSEARSFLVEIVSKGLYNVYFGCNHSSALLVNSIKQATKQILFDIQLSSVFLNFNRYY